MAHKNNDSIPMSRRSPVGHGNDDFDDGEKNNGLMDRPHLATSPSAASSQPLSTINNSAPASIVAYCLSSISMTVVNKYVVSGDQWNLTSLYLAAQSAVCTCAIIALSYLGLVKISPLDLQKVKKWLPVSFLLAGMLYTGARALQYLSVPVYTIFKNLAIIAIAYGEVLWFGSRVTPLALVAFGLMVLSSIVAAWADIQSALAGDMGNPDDEFSAISTLNAGYAWMTANVVCNAAYVLRMRKVIKKMNFQDRDTMLYNNLLSIPTLFLCSLLTEDWSRDNLAKNFPEESRNSILVGIIYSGLAAIFISYCSAWCLRVTSSTTFSMVGALNKLPVALSGLVFFSAPVTVGSVSAIMIGFISGIVFAVAKIKESEAEKNSLPVTEDSSVKSKD